MRCLSHKSLLISFIVISIVLGLTDAQRRRNRKGRPKDRFEACHQKQADKCLAKLRGLGKEKEPTAIIATSAGIDRLCKIIKDDTIECFHKYFKTCSTPIHKELSNLIIDITRLRTNRFCSDQKHRAELLTQSPCIHEKVYSTEAYRSTCNNNYLTVLDSVDMNKTNSDEVHATLCCAINKWQQCSTVMIGEQCGDAGKTVYTNFMKNTFGGFGDQWCPIGQFSEASAVCVPILSKPVVEKFKVSDDNNAMTKFMLAFFSWLYVV